MPETITSIEKENNALKRQIESLQKDFSKLQIMIESKESPKQDGASKETKAQMHSFQTSLDFVSNEYDTLNAFQIEAKNEFKKLNSRLTEIAMKVNDVGDALEQIQHRKEDDRPSPIICKFVRRNSKVIVTKQRRETNKVNPSVRIFDHLTPKNQQILFEAKGFKARNDYQYCSTKNSAVYLRKYANFRAIRINELHDLLRLQNSNYVPSS
ncbi:Hypothetical predicted protein [Paramuricea clavata]|uniref:FP protein C-terminal domain-containing protein n=1 Tax=Paramuricea clavata TaxID=317549 RepID=A0A7D9LWW5_PARCT|nr:Hypothetical predicted protein [Paramuricea clavata]